MADRIYIWVLLVFLTAQAVQASISSEWKLEIDSTIVFDGNTATGQFTAGVSPESTDEIDIKDGRMIESPSYSIPFYSVIDGEYFMFDYGPFNQSKIWQIIQRGSKEFRGSGTLSETVTWDISNVPSDVNVTLIDYGQDSTRTSILMSIDLKKEDSYKFEVTTPYGDYRYFDLVAVLTEELNQETQDQQETPNSGSSSGGSISRTILVSNEDSNKTEECAEDWDCGSWSECLEDEKQTKDCTDNNDCGTVKLKPSESRTCTYKIQESTEEKVQKQEESIKDSKPITSVTGNVVMEISKPNPLVGIFVSIIIVILGLGAFFFLSRKFI
jgi:hypothetical protein